MEFVLRIFITDYYLTKPLSYVDNTYNDFTCKEINQVPIIRIYGTTPKGQKVCSHIHGVFPYFYIEFPNDLSTVDNQRELDKFLIDFMNSLNRALKNSLTTRYFDDSFIYRIVLVKGKQFYGYQDDLKHFLKIYLYDPSIVARAGELLLSGAVMNKIMQPFETHIPYNLKFFIDYNLYGMNFLFTDGAKFRLDKDQNMDFDYSAYSDDMFVNASQKYWRFEDIMNCNNYMESRICTKMSSCELEVDIASCDILNIWEVEGNIGQNPGLKNLWEEEKERRLTLGLTLSDLVGELFEERPLAKNTNSELKLLEKWNQITQSVDTVSNEKEMENSDIDQFIDGSQIDEDVQLLNKSVNDTTIFDLSAMDLSFSEKKSVTELIDEKNIDKFINYCVKLEEDDSIMQPDVDDIQNDQITLKGSSFSQVTELKHQTVLVDTIELDSDSDTDELFNKTFIDLSLNTESDEELLKVAEETDINKIVMPKDKIDQNTSCEDLFSDMEMSSDSDSSGESISLLETYDGADDEITKKSSMRKRRGSESTSSKTSTMTLSQKQRIIDSQELSLIPMITKKLMMKKKTKPRKCRPGLQLKSKTDVTKTLVSENETDTDQINSFGENKKLLISQVMKTPTKQSFSSDYKSSTVVTEESPSDQEPIILTPTTSSKPVISTPARLKTISLTQQFKNISPISKQSEKSITSFKKNVSFNIPEVSKESPHTSPYKATDLHSQSLEKSQKLSLLEKMKKSVTQSLHHMSSTMSFLDQNISETCHLTILSGELFSCSQINLKPNPKFDSILMFFYAVHHENDEPDDSSFVNQPINNGIIYVDNGEDFMRTCGIVASFNQQFVAVSDEAELMDKIINLVWEFDPDILVGFETVRSSWGHLFERAFHLKHKLFHSLGRLLHKKDTHFYKDPEKEFRISELHCEGRIILNLWIILKHELSLNSYTVENCVSDVLKERVPHYTNQQLLAWFKSNKERHLVVKYFSYRVLANIRLLMKLNIVGRTAEFAKIYGIEFYHVLSRGSQYRVEAMMLRLAKPQNLIAISPSVGQRSHQKAPECIPLTLEPRSGLYRDPVVVLDFQSLYPSVMIAYNYCYATTLGKLDHIAGVRREEPYELGCSKMFLDEKTIQKVGSDVTLAPNGVAFVRSEIQKGIISKMVEEILNTRIMVKKSMKIHSENKALCKILDSRQLGLKLIANVTFGYTAASFSGRMPCVEVGDSIVRKSRETLEETIKLVNSGGPDGIAKSDADGGWAGCSVIYGDTDSVFVLMPNRTKMDAFKLGARIADAVSARNPFPVKLKFEKVFYPCLLEAKKRYVGFSYESPDQIQPKFDAKGIETVRRDNCGIVSKILERSLTRLFSSDNMDSVQRYVTKELDKIIRGDINLIDFIIAKEYRGRHNYKPCASVPALHIARELIKSDPRAEPLKGERVAYVVIQGAPGDTLISCVRQPESLLFNTQFFKAYGNNIRMLSETECRLSHTYYITKQILPPLDRALSLVNVDVFKWYSQIPKRFSNTAHIYIDPTSNNLLNRTISSYFRSRHCMLCHSVIPCRSDFTKNNLQAVLCDNCIKSGKRHIYLSAVTQLQDIEECRTSILKQCYGCTNMLPSYRGIGPPCVSKDCHLFFSRIRAFQQPTMNLERLLNCREFNF